MRFPYKLTLAQRRTGGTLALMLRPRLNQLPLAVQRYDDPFLPFGKAIIAQTADIVSAYLFDLAAYLALGAAGLISMGGADLTAADPPKTKPNPNTGVVWHYGGTEKRQHAKRDQECLVAEMHIVPRFMPQAFVNRASVQTKA